jgi:hypothetical protein
LELVSKSGEVVAHLTEGMGELAGATLLLKNPGGGFVTLSATPVMDDGPWISVSGPTGNTTVGSTSLTVTAFDPVKMQKRKELLEREGNRALNTDAWKATIEKPAVELRASVQRGGSLGVCNPLGNPVISAESNKRNEGEISLNDVDGRPSVVLAPK